MSKTVLFKEINAIINSLNIDSITEERKVILQPFIGYVQQKVNANKSIRINFICTHNSRRSHLSQVWAQTLASYFNVPKVFCYSGGTEATALFPMAAETLKGMGFQIQNLSEGKNPVYSIKYSGNEPAVIGFSKKLDDDFNPTSEFIAIMTCSEADNGCPIVLGAEVRVPITFEDPKAFDNTPLQAAKYRERSLQIATELFYVFSNISS